MMKSQVPDLGNHQESTQCGTVYTRTFERGFQLKKRGGEWVTLDAGEADQLAMTVRHAAKYCPLFTQVEVIAVLQLAGKSKIQAKHIIKAYQQMSAADHLKIYDTIQPCADMVNVREDP